MNYKQDCIYFLSDRPCKFHKDNASVVCANCKFYKPVNKKILVIKLAAIGDVVRTTCILKPIHTRWKNSKLTWITEDNAVEVLYNNSYINEVIPLSQSFLLFSEKFDIMINLDLDLDALRLTRNIFAKQIYGFYLDGDNRILCSNDAAKQWFDLSHNDLLKKKNQKTYQQYLMEILEFKDLSSSEYPIIIKLTDEEKLFAKNFIEPYVSNNEKSKKFVFVGINLGGGDKWEKKEYPVPQTVELMKLIASSKNYVGKEIKILLFGGVKEEQRNKKIITLFTARYPLLSTKIIDTGCNNTLRQFFSLVNLCDVVITSDSLALHIALALKKKVVVLFGPTSANEIELYGLGTKIVSNKSCVVCYRRNCDKKPDCMETITPVRVYHELLKILK
ncbi:MAG: glycosyltransferase family 9 protein [Endomicrobia bacterium]|nr:glycosyltransferase family 9 protein [Endomicrobiia bacterium]MDW8055691.1 glycosyltransferase family 9 protein [Elusimicrobiota bacterium]